MKPIVSLVLRQKLLLVVCLIGWFALNQHTAFAATAQGTTGQHCLGAFCNGTNPYETGCAGGTASWSVEDSSPLLNFLSAQKERLGWVQLWHSTTCGTSWSRYTSTSGQPAGFSKLDLFTTGPGYGVEDCNAISAPCIWLSDGTYITGQYYSTIPVYAEVLLDGKPGAISAQTQAF